MNESDQKIREAANAFEKALTAGGKNYVVSIDRFDVTDVDSDGTKLAYNIGVTEVPDPRVIVP